MPEHIQFTIPITPKGQARPRMSVIAGHAHVYESTPAREYKEALVTLAAAYRPKQPFDEGVDVCIIFRFALPRSWPKRRQAAPPAHTSRPDLENLAKPILDALTRCGYWRDDSQVNRLTAMKYYAPIGDAGSVDVIVEAAC